MVSRRTTLTTSSSGCQSLFRRRSCSRAGPCLLAAHPSQDWLSVRACACRVSCWDGVGWRWLASRCLVPGCHSHRLGTSAGNVAGRRRRVRHASARRRTSRRAAAVDRQSGLTLLPPRGSEGSGPTRRQRVAATTEKGGTRPASARSAGRGAGEAGVSGLHGAPLVARRPEDRLRKHARHARRRQPGDLRHERRRQRRAEADSDAGSRVPPLLVAGRAKARLQPVSVKARWAFFLMNADGSGVRKVDWSLRGKS
jgi:hypothetical protein